MNLANNLIASAAAQPERMALRLDGAAVSYAALDEASARIKGGANATTQELRDHVKSRVAAYKYARRVCIVDELPKGPTGKVLTREIKVPADDVALANPVRI